MVAKTHRDGYCQAWIMMCDWDLMWMKRMLKSSVADATSVGLLVLRAACLAGMS